MSSDLEYVPPVVEFDDFGVERVHPMVGPTLVYESTVSLKDFLDEALHLPKDRPALFVNALRNRTPFFLEGYYVDLNSAPEHFCAPYYLLKNKIETTETVPIMMVVWDDA